MNMRLISKFRQAFAANKRFTIQPNEHYGIYTGIILVYPQFFGVTTAQAARLTGRS
jgi:hypothetical protein